MPTLRGAHTATHAEVSAATTTTAATTKDHARPTAISHTAATVNSTASTIADTRSRRTSATV
ncbi:MAG: hypothetical protein LOY04_17770 [Rhodococcus ruber]|nr:hypothetical protein [Rhodococcus ruber]